jgi:hypothetical protein
VKLFRNADDTKWLIEVTDKEKLKIMHALEYLAIGMKGSHPDVAKRRNKLKTMAGQLRRAVRP